MTLRAIIIAAFFALGLSPGMAQITPGGGGGAATQDINVTGINGSAPGPTAPFWVAPATGATFPISGNVSIIPSSSSSAAISPSATTSAASNSVLKGSAGILRSLTVTVGATSGWVMVFDATALPGNGATGSSLKWCYPVNSDGTKGGIDKDWSVPLNFATGITVGFSSTACNTLTASATAFFYGEVQ